MSGSCPVCDLPLEESLLNCSKCGWSAPVPQPQTATRTQDRVAGALAYMTFLPAILFLVIDPYRRRRFVRFHSFQSIFFFGSSALVAIVFGLFSSVLLGHLLALLFLMIFAIGWGILWLVLMAKALLGEYLLLPWLGNFAYEQAQGSNSQSA